MSCENLRELLDRISRRLGVDLQLDEENFALVQIDSDFDLTFEYEDDRETLLMTAVCGELPPRNREAVLSALLEANFYGAGTGGGILSLNSKTGEVYFHYRVTTTQLDEELLEASMQRMVDNAETWIARLKAIGGEDAGRGAEPGDHGGQPLGTGYDAPRPNFMFQV
ncbi:hypothetical protein DB346_12735 [Verrucomicrobia bacterium LW23]|nr:hypothetical protein DB346_12735 [Verrucomicrobia bacterium LW23]